MSLFRHLWHAEKTPNSSAIAAAVERAVSAVEPMLKQAGGYPSVYEKPVAHALEYAQTLAAQVPGPVEISREAYAENALVHALFPSADSVDEAFDSSPAVRDYLHRLPLEREAYAFMGMRRMGKSTLGMELYGAQVRRDVRQDTVYFTSHVLEGLASTEQQARQLMALDFFDRLVVRVAERIARRKQRKDGQIEARNRMMARMHSASAGEKTVLQKKIDEKNTRLQAITHLLELHNYTRDFKAVLLNPEQYLKLSPVRIVMDGMGIRRHDGKQGAHEITFYDLIGFDRRRWTVAMVHCRELHTISISERLEKARRRLIF